MFESKMFHPVITLPRKRLEVEAHAQYTVQLKTGICNKVRVDSSWKEVWSALFSRQLKNV